MLGYLCQMAKGTEPALTLPSFEAQIRLQGQSKQIFDIVRKRYVALTPEEWVRQHLIHHLVTDHRYPASLLAVEKLVKVNQLTQRADVVVYDLNAKPWMIVECKAPSVHLGNDTFLQAARYCSTLRVPFLLLTNGLVHYCFSVDSGKITPLSEFPPFPA